MNQIEKSQSLELAEHYFHSNNHSYAEHILNLVVKEDPNNSKANELLAYIHGNNGNFDKSLHLLELATKEKDCSAEAFYYLGQLLLKKNNYIDAIECFSKSMLVGGVFFEALHDLGSAYAFLGKTELALENYQKCLVLKKDSYELYLNIGGILGNMNRHNEALNNYDCAIKLNPKSPEAWCNKSNTLLNLKRYDEALNFYDHAIKLNSNYPGAWANKGNLLVNLKRYDEALICYEHAIKLNPNYPEAWSNKGNALVNLKRYDEALNCYDHAIKLNPNYPEAWSNKGVLLSTLKRYDEALNHYDRAIELMPTYANAWSSKGMTLNKMKLFSDALKNYDRAIQINPEFPEALMSKGEILDSLKQYDEALTHIEQATKLSKNDENYSLGQALHIKMKMCNWSSFEESVESCLKSIQKKEKAINPFPLLALIDDPEAHRKCAEIFSKDRYPENLLLESISLSEKKQKIRVAYFSADFKNHPISFLTAELYERHNKEKFEIIAFSLSGNEKSEMRNRLAKSFDHFIDVSDKSDLEIVLLARSLKIDIAVDLGGYTLNNPLPIFALRAAPIQITYLGYLGTLATPYIDYVIGDNVVIPDTYRQFFSEKIIQLPCFQVNDQKREVSEKKFTRQELGLPNDGFVFCCFNNNYKITPLIFDSWMKILKNVDGSVLFLYAENKWVEENLRQEAEIRFVNKNRLIFGKALPRGEYMSRYLTCDLFLDTFPYNAGTTASDALWMGLPVLTYSGKSFASRMAGSLLSSVGINELVTYTLKDYEELAIFLANNPNELSLIKNKLIQNKKEFPLFNTELFAKNLEKAYESAFSKYICNKSPEHIEIL